MTKNVPADRRVGLSDLLEDLFGLSLRGLATMWAMLANPKPAFAAARLPDWRDRNFTPSIRLVLSLLALLTAIRFLWTGENSLMYGSTLDALKAAGAANSDELAREQTEQILDNFVWIYPIAFLTFLGIITAITPVWGKGTSIATRIRLGFLAIIPSVFLSVLMTVSVGFLADDMLSWMMIAPILLGWILDFATPLRGGIAGASTGVRLGKAALFATGTFIGGMAANLGAFIGAQFWIDWSAALPF
ncbi:MAG: hypothetical protein CMK07_13350 [Ponticaulis sp.]|nr:hypothetical protein [Ponticaulis sp.]